MLMNKSRGKIPRELGNDFVCTCFSCLNTPEATMSGFTSRGTCDVEAQASWPPPGYMPVCYMNLKCSKMLWLHNRKHGTKVHKYKYIFFATQ